MARHWVHGGLVPVTITITVAIPMSFTLVAAPVIGALVVIVTVVIAIVAHDDDRRRIPGRPVVPGRPVLAGIPPVVTRRRRRVSAVPVEVMVILRVLVAGWDCDAARDGQRADDEAEPSRRDTSTNEAHGQSSASSSVVLQPSTIPVNARERLRLTPAG